MSGTRPHLPGDLNDRRLPLYAVAAGTGLYRIHRHDHPALSFSRAVAGRSGSGRWDSPEGAFGTCYLATRQTTAFAETLLHEPGIVFLSRSEIAARVLSLIEVLRPLRLVRFHGPGLTRLGADASVAHGDRRDAQRWAAALHDHPSRPDGIIWRARPDDDGRSVALFDHVQNSLSAAPPTPLHRIPRLASWLDRYGVGLG